jgi:hypothetical protein
MLYIFFVYSKMCGKRTFTPEQRKANAERSRLHRKKMRKVESWRKKEDERHKVGTIYYLFQ